MQPMTDATALPGVARRIRNTEKGTQVPKVLPSKKANSGAHGMDVRGLDFYPTSTPVTQALLDSGEGLPKLVWEPCVGMGDMAKVLVAAGHEVIGTDIVSYGWPGQMAIKDFFEYTEAPRFSPSGQRPTAIVSNPPFFRSAEFVRHGLKLCKKVIILNRLAFMEGAARSDIIDGNLTRVYVFTNRCPMLHRWNQDEKTGEWREWQGKKAPSATPMAFFVFEREKSSPGFFCQRISWRKSMIRLAATTENTANLLK
jgi:hypothetical protein